MPCDHPLFYWMLKERRKKKRKALTMGEKYIGISKFESIAPGAYVNLPSEINSQKISLSQTYLLTHIPAPPLPLLFAHSLLKNTHHCSTTTYFLLITLAWHPACVRIRGRTTH